MIYIDDIIYAHELLIKNTGGIAGLRDISLLESAVSAPFIDGNKRIGILVMITFLESYEINLGCSDNDLIKLGLSVADGTFADKDIFEFIIKHEKQ